jgi:hypothetical protein
MNEIKEGTKNWKVLPYSYIGRINIAKMSTILKMTDKFKAIPMKYQ